jgi:hypothetical protein
VSLRAIAPTTLNVLVAKTVSSGAAQQVARLPGRVTSNKLATVALMSPFPESDHQAPHGIPPLRAKIDQSAGQQKVVYSITSSANSGGVVRTLFS